MPTTSFQAPVPPASFQAPVNDNTLWGQIMAPGAEPGSVQQQQPSLLPVPYQNQATVRPGHIGGQGGALIPAIPGEEGPIYVPPMYTKPRAIIPRYRAISGLISVVVVFALLCTGAGFYAKATGKLSFLHQLYGDARPKNLVPTQVVLPAPSPPEFFKGSTIITSATTASKIDKQTAQPLDQTATFKVGDTIFLTYSVHPKTAGTVTVIWYTNNNFYQKSTPIAIKDAESGYVPIQFSQPQEGSVELYWNDQLAIRLYFVVQPVGV